MNEKYRKKYQKPVAESDSLAERLSRQEEFKLKMSAYLKNTQTEREEDNMKRDLSQRVISRWYRSPEISLIYPDYDKSCDIWSLGCVLAELMACSKPYSSKKMYQLNRRILFSGHSSYPLSPRRDIDNKSIKHSDQMFKILEKIKIDLDIDASFLTDENSISFLKDIA